MNYEGIKRYLLGWLLMWGGILAVSAQSSGDGYSPDSPTEPGNMDQMLAYTVTASPNIVGAGTVTGSGKYQPGKSVTLKATANSGYKFLYWLKDNATTSYSTNAQFNYTTTTENVRFTAVFEKAKSVAVKINDTNAGTVSGASSAMYKGGTTTISTTPKTDYRFLYWLKNDETVAYSAQSSFVYTMEDESVTFTAVYEYVAPPYTPENPSEPNEDPTKMVSYNLSVQLNDAAAGVVTGNGKYKWGTSVNVSTSPNAGYEFRKWLKGEDDYSTATQFSYTVTSEDVTFTAVYEYVGVPEPEPTSHKLYLIASQEGGCTFSMANGTDVNIGESYTVTATMGTDFVFGGWFLGTQLLTTNKTYEGVMGQENVILTANCIYTPSSPDDPGAVEDDGTYTDKRRKVTIVSSNEVFGSVATTNVTAAGVALAGTEVSATAKVNEDKAESGIEFKGWSKEGTVVSTETTYAFTVEENVTLVAVFQAPLTTKLGDADNSGEVDVTDITAVVSHIYGSTPANFNEVAANVNGDSDIDVTDITGIVTIIYSGDGESNTKAARSKGCGFATISTTSMTVSNGETLELPIYVNGLEAYSSLQFDVCLPEGVRVTDAAVSPVLALAHSTNAAYVGDKYRVMSFSMSNRKFTASDEPAVVLTLHVDDVAEDGNHEIAITNACVSAIGEKVKPYIKGGNITVNGATAITAATLGSSQLDAYSLTGIRLGDTHNAKGVYIIKGKKYVK